MSAIHDKWLLGQIPILNGVTFLSGKVHPIKPVIIREKFPIFLETEDSFNIDEIPRVQWTFASPSSRDTKPDSIVVAGECGMGADGFVAFLDSAEIPQWICFFDFSNPFVSVRREGESIFAVNNLNECWILNSRAPWVVKVELIGSK